ncbi:hypothetical protein Tco_1224673, partial [Tanacetum coccineum]
IEDEKETDEHEEVDVDDEVELKKHLVIVKDDDIAIDAIPLATKPLVIVEYKLLKEGIMGIDREDLETLWKLVKIKHSDTRPEDEHERVLWVGAVHVSAAGNKNEPEKLKLILILLFRMVIMVLVTAFIPDYGFGFINEFVLNAARIGLQLLDLFDIGQNA